MYRMTQPYGLSMAGSISRWATSSASWASLPSQSRHTASPSRFLNHSLRIPGEGTSLLERWPELVRCSLTCLVRRGDKGDAGPLYKQAAEAQVAIAAAKDATSEDHLRLGQTLRSQGDLLRLNGQLAQAKPVYGRALTVLKQAWLPTRNTLRFAMSWHSRATRGAGSTASLAKSRLPVRITATRWICSKSSSPNFPTAPRYRESMAKACNSLGLLEETTGSLVEAETYYRRELPLVDRLAQDFPTVPNTAANWLARFGTSVMFSPETVMVVPTQCSKGQLR